jgi:hypothetical protein
MVSGSIPDCFGLAFASASERFSSERFAPLPGFPPFPSTPGALPHIDAPGNLKPGNRCFLPASVRASATCSGLSRVAEVQHRYAFFSPGIRNIVLFSQVCDLFPLHAEFYGYLIIRKGIFLIFIFNTISDLIDHFSTYPDHG